MAANLEAEDARSLLMCIFKATFADLVLKRRLRWFCRRATGIKFKWDTSFRGVITHGEARMTIQLTSIHSSYIIVPYRQGIIVSTEGGHGKITLFLGQPLKKHKPESQRLTYNRGTRCSTSRSVNLTSRDT